MRGRGARCAYKIIKDREDQIQLFCGISSRRSTHVIIGQRRKWIFADILSTQEYFIGTQCPCWWRTQGLPEWWWRQIKGNAICVTSCRKVRTVSTKLTLWWIFSSELLLSKWRCGECCQQRKVFEEYWKVLLKSGFRWRSRCFTTLWRGWSNMQLVC